MGTNRFINNIITPNDPCVATGDCLSPDEILYLSSGQEPELYYSQNMYNDVREAKGRYYLKIIGVSEFNGAYESEENIIAQAKNVGATLVICEIVYTDTETNQGIFFLPDFQTSRHSGSIYSGLDSAIYSGTSTTYGTQAVPYINSTRLYNQSATFLVEVTRRPMFGALLADLTLEQRKTLGSNKGVLVDVVLHHSPAFNADIFPDDIIVQFNNREIIDMNHFWRLLDAKPSSQTKILLKVYREGVYKNILVDTDKRKLSKYLSTSSDYDIEGNYKGKQK